MKSLLLSFILLLSFTTTEYHDLIGKNTSDEEVQKFLKVLGSDYEYDDTFDERNFYIYDSKGIELTVSKEGILRGIFFKTENLDPSIELPLGLKATDTREDVESKLGAPDRSMRGMSDYRVYYVNEGVVIRYRSRDEANMNNPIKSVSVEKVKAN